LGYFPKFFHALGI